MIIFPAIDLQNATVVRLRQGSFSDVTVYSPNPVAMAQTWANQGAQWLHVVDLDGARTGEMKNYRIIQRIARNVTIPVQVGGGIRNLEDIEDLLASGINRVILSTKVIEDKEFLKKALSLWPDAIAVSVDCVNGFVTQKGWTAVTKIRATDFVKELEQKGLRYLIYTDIKRDGMLQGPNVEALKEILKAVKLSVIASGGVSNIGDIKRLLNVPDPNLIGVITGKAIYEGALNLAEAIDLCSQSA